VTRACRAAREASVARFGLKTVPSARPSLERAQALYAQSCQVCHGERGDADTERARELEPRPASFRDPERLAMLSPYRVYNALTFGVPGTGMAAFDALSPAERWDLAFFVFRLGHDGRKAARAAAVPLPELATRTDLELLAALRAGAAPAPAEALAHLRHDAPFSQPPTAAGLAQARALVAGAVAAFSAGREADAQRLAIDAYLQGFEPLEPQLRARDAAGTLAIESAFRDLRVALAGTDRAAVEARGEALSALLARVGEAEGRPLVPFVASAVIYFREGIEAALLVGALLAGLRKLGRPDAAAYVHRGWLLALPAGVLTWWLFDRVLALGVARRELLEASVALAAAAVLFSVSFWMISKAESRRWMAYLRRSVEASLSRRSLALLSGLAFMAVYREAAETVLFTQCWRSRSRAGGSTALCKPATSRRGPCRFRRCPGSGSTPISRASRSSSRSWPSSPEQASRH
jgi:high-affinity iron transporter